MGKRTKMSNGVNKLIILIIVIIAAGIGAYFIFQKPAFPEPLTPSERSSKTSTLEQSIEATKVQKIGKDSPFGMHPAYIMPSGQGYSEKSFQDALNLGVKWHRPSMYMVWPAVQKDLNSQNYDFSRYDKYYGEVPSEINIFANITSRIKQESEYTLAGSFLPVDEQKYLNFVKAVVERYDGDGKNDMPGLKNPILYWQVGNEPNNRGGIKDFAKFQKITYQVIKEACSQCKVLVGGAAQPIVPNKGFVMDEREYFDRFSVEYEPILKELNGEGFDIFDFHWYGTAGGDYRKLGLVYERIKVLLKNYGFDGVPVWITEMGAYSGDPIETFFPYQTETQQAADYLKRFIYPLSLGIEKIFPAFGLMEGFKGKDDYFDHTGFIYDGKGSNDLSYGVKKLSYYTYKKMAETLEGSDWNNIQTIQEADDVYVYKFSKAGKPIWVAWNDNSASKIITISGISSTQIKITEAVPKYESGKDVADYNTAFNTETKSVSSEKLTITLKNMPVFIKEK